MPTKKPGADDGVSARALAQSLGVSRETIFAWVARGLLPSVTFRGAYTRYSASHQLRAKVVAKLRAEGVAYDDIAPLLELSDDELAARHFPAPSPQPTPVGSGLPTWQRVELLPGLELHIAMSASAFVRRIADEVVARYRAAAP
ncbi:MAG: MerR family transcriptional regulator [Deltaproteobacteria bacterium]|nr:MerR family transcriptional regulator [Myxococcales bacterium]MDP3217353.1 MerR family transcriptional regulator [Deltaproteobacteria bacterium]